MQVTERGPEAPRKKTGENMVEDALFIFAKSVRAQHFENEEQLRGYVLAFCMEYPAIHHALAGFRLVDRMAHNYAGMRRPAMEYLRAVDGSFTRRAPEVL